MPVATAGQKLFLGRQRKPDPASMFGRFQIDASGGCIDATASWRGLAEPLSAVTPW